MLNNGQQYNVKIVAVFAGGGESPPSLVSQATPGTSLPPTGLSVVGGNQKLTVSFTPPEFTGGYDIINYSYDVWPATDTNHTENWQLLTTPKVTSPIVIPGLVNDTLYRFKLRPVNQIGAGQASPELTGTPRFEVPSAPTITSVTAGNASLTAAFVAPSSDGGKPVTSYKYSVNDGVTKLDYTETSSPIDIENLTNGTKYSVILYAVNEVGVGAPSEMVEGTPAEGATPSAPKITGITSGLRQLSVAFTPPAGDNGSAITRYQYKLNSGRWTTRKPETSLASPIILPGLASNTEYKVRLRAVNSAGAGASSAAALGKTIVTGPNAPKITGVSYYGGLKDDSGSQLINAHFTVFFRLPEDLGGLPIAGIDTKIDSPGFMVGGTWTVPIISLADFYNMDPLLSKGAVLPTPFSDGMLRIINSNFNDYASFQSSRATITLQLFSVQNNNMLYGEISLPYRWTDDPDGPGIGPPGSVTAIALNSTSILISFIPYYVNGVTFDTYKYSLDGGFSYSATVQAVNDTITVENLTPGTPYKVMLATVEGSPPTEVASTPSPEVNVTTEPEVPTAPTIYNIVGLENTLVVQFSPPIVPGGVILDYEYSLNGGSFVSSGLRSSPITLTGTSNDVPYTVAVRAVNQVGVGEVSNTATGISGSPSAPTITAVQVGKGRLGAGGELQVYFNPPISDGGSNITKYHYSIDNGVTYTSILNTTTYTTSVSPITISNLVNGSTYQIRVKAENARSIGEPSQAVSGTPYTTPSAPTITQVVVDTSKLGTATLHFTPPTSNGGSTILSYDYSTNNGNVWQNSASAVSDGYIAFTTSKSNSTVAQVVLRAVNAAGPGAVSNRVNANPITEPTPPGSLELVQSQLNPAQLTLRFTPPTSDGGSAVTHYAYTVYGASPDEVYIPASQLSAPLPYTVLLPNVFSYGTTAQVVMRAINLGANTSSPITTNSGVSSLRFTSLHIMPYTFNLPTSWVQFGTIIYNEAEKRFYQPITLKLPCNPSNTYIGKDISLIQPLVTSVNYSFSNPGAAASGQVFDIAKIQAQGVAERTSFDPPGIFTFTTDPRSLPYLIPNKGDYEFTFTAHNPHYTSAPYVLKTNYTVANLQLVTAPSPGGTKPPEYRGINFINISHALKYRRLQYLKSGPILEYNMSIVEIYADLENSEIFYSLSLRRAGYPTPDGFEAQGRVTHEVTLPIAKDYHPHEPAIGGGYSITNNTILPDPQLFNGAEKPLLYEVWRRTTALNRAVDTTPGGLPFEGEVLSGGKQMLTLKIIGFNIGDEVKLTLAAKNNAGVTYPSQTITLNTSEDIAANTTYTMQPVWWACMAAPTPYAPNIAWGSPRGYLTIIQNNNYSKFPLTTQYAGPDVLSGPSYLIGGGYGRSMPAVCNEAYPPGYTGGTIMLIAYDIEIYKLPKNVLLGWRYRGEGDLMWRWFLQFDSATSADPIFREAMRTTLNHCPSNMLDLKRSQSPFPDVWYNDSYYFPDYSGNNRALLRMTLLEETWQKLNTFEGAIDPRQLEFITCTAIEPTLGIPTQNIGPVIPYYLNTSDPYVKECYASPPVSSGRVSVDVPLINYDWDGPAAPYAWDGYWTPAPVQTPTNIEINAFKARYPKYFSTTSN